MNISLSNLENSTNAGFIIPGQATGDRLGSEVYGAGDINGDGIDDLVVTTTDAGIVSTDAYSYFDSDRRGEAYVVFGRQSGFENPLNLDNLDGNNGFRVSGLDKQHNLGEAVAAGDINGDGIDDLVVGAPQAGLQVSSYGYSYSENNGEAYVIFGRQAGFGADFDLQTLDGSNGFIIKGIDAEDLLGTAVSSGGDINGDGIDDLAVSAVGGGSRISNSNGFSYSDRRGEVYVLFGDRNGFESRINLFNLNGSNGFIVDGKDANDSLGGALSSAGDINGDGLDDLIIAAPNAGDVLDSPFAEGNSDQRGEVYVLFGRRDGFSSRFNLRDGINGNNGFLLTGEGIEDNLGSDVSNAGDLNGDGIEDLIIGAANASVGGEYTHEGRAYVLFGRRDGFGTQFDLSNLDGNNGFSLTGLNNDSGLGNTVSAGDFNGDGIDDLFIGGSEGGETVSAYGFEYSDRRGEAYIIFGKASGFTSTLDLGNLNPNEGIKIAGVNPGDLLGSDISSGDLNNDGAYDLIISAPEVNQSGEYSREGTVYTIFGTPPSPIEFIQATPYNDKLDGTVFGDRLFGLSGDDTIDGKAGNDTLAGDDGSDTLFGRRGEDVLTGGNNNDILFGGKDNDLLQGGNNQDRLFGGLGEDTLFGGTDNDLLQGGDANDTLNGTDPNNDLVQLGEQDTLVGNAGSDLFIFGDEKRVYYSDLNSQTIGRTDYAFIRDFDLTRDKIQLNGDPDSYRLFFYTNRLGQARANIFHRVPGSKLELIGIINNVMPGLTLQSSTFVYVGEAPVTDPNDLATPFSDRIVGTAVDDMISGNSGDDTLIGGDGNDILNGEAGGDSLLGDGGNDTLNGGSNNDTLIGGLGNDQLNGDDNQDRLVGDEGNDLLLGGTQNDLLEGGLGNDTLIGTNYGNLEVQLGEQDTLIGGAGSDFLILGDRDRMFYNDRNPNTGGDTDYALIRGFDFDQDTIQLQGDRSMYDLTFYTDGSGTTLANLLYLEPGSVPERVGILEDVSPDLTTANRALFYV
ncbi:MAG: hypothetical protein AAFQ41_06535 [Cyanobacteria bacterium J06623_7]